MIPTFRLSLPGYGIVGSWLAAAIAAMGVFGHACSVAQESTVIERLSSAGVDMARVQGDFENVEPFPGARLLALGQTSKAAIGPTQPSIPVFLPLEQLAPDDMQKSAGGARAVADAHCDQMLAFKDGYDTTCTYPSYELTVTGTTEVFGEPGAKSAEFQTDYIHPFSETEAGGSISFGYAGAHYIARFECPRGGEPCIDAATARAIFENFLVCAFDGKCVESGYRLIQR